MIALGAAVQRQGRGGSIVDIIVVVVVIVVVSAAVVAVDLVRVFVVLISRQKVHSRCGNQFITDEKPSWINNKHIT